MTCREVPLKLRTLPWAIGNACGFMHQLGSAGAAIAKHPSSGDFLEIYPCILGTAIRDAGVGGPGFSCGLSSAFLLCLPVVVPCVCTPGVQFLSRTDAGQIGVGSPVLAHFNRGTPCKAASPHRAEILG